MIARYPHAPTCWSLRPFPDPEWPDAKSPSGCTCQARELQSAFDAGKRETELRFVSYTGDGVCPWCSALNAQEDGKAGGDTEHFAACPHVSASVTRISDARAEGKEAGKLEADARAMASFVRGFCAAAAQMERHETAVVEMLRSINATEKLLRDSEVDDFDLDVLRPALRELARKQHARGRK